MQSCLPSYTTDRTQLNATMLYKIRKSTISWRKAWRFSGFTSVAISAFALRKKREKKMHARGMLSVTKACGMTANTTTSRFPWTFIREFYHELRGRLFAQSIDLRLKISNWNEDVQRTCIYYIGEIHILYIYRREGTCAHSVDTQLTYSQEGSMISSN